MPNTEDLELIQALQIAPRASWRAIGAAIHRPPAALAERWQRLTDEGLAWCTAVPLGDAPHGTLVFIAVLIEPGKRKTFLAEAMLIPEVISIEEPATHWDLILSVLATNIEELLYRILPLIAGLDGLARRETIICTRLHFAGHEWRVDALDPPAVAALERLGRLSKEDAQPLREEDRALIPLLFRDGRASVSDVAAELGAHASTISRRMNRVLADPRISLRCDIAPVVLQQPISCQWFSWLPPDRHAAAAEALREFPNLRFCASTTGQTNFTFVIWVRSPDEIFDVERRVVEKIADLSISENSVTARFHKRMGWRLDPQGRRAGEPVLPAFLT